MSDTDKVFAGSIPENYDRYIVIDLQAVHAADLARPYAAASYKQTILETAASSRVVARALAPKLSPGASYIVTDLNQPML